MNLKNLLLLLFLSGGMVSCIKELADDEQVPTTPEEVQQVMGDAWGQADPLSMQPNDFLFQETEQKVEGSSEAFFVLQEGITISKKEERENDYLYTFLYQTKEVKQGQEGALSTREAQRTVGKSDPALQTAQLGSKELKAMAGDYELTFGFQRIYGLAYACAKTEDMDKYCKETLGYDSCDVTCSNLKTSEEMRPLPRLIQEQPNCGGFEGCKYKVKQVQFDWTIALTKGDSVEKQKVNYSVAVSPDMPFLSRLTEYCFKQLYTVQNQKLLVNTCTKLKDFKKGGS